MCFLPKVILDLLLRVGLPLPPVHKWDKVSLHNFSAQAKIGSANDVDWCFIAHEILKLLSWAEIYDWAIDINELGSNL